MLGVDERQNCYICEHPLAAHETSWKVGLDLEPSVLEVKVCRTEHCLCEGFLPDPWQNLGERPLTDQLGATYQRTAFSVRWDYHQIAVPAGTRHPNGVAQELDVEMARLGKEGWELVMSENLGEYRIYRFKKPVMTGVLIR